VAEYDRRALKLKGGTQFREDFMPTVINFGAPIPPMEDRSPAPTVYPRSEDQIVVEEPLEEVVDKLSTEASWPQFTIRLGDGTRPVYVNPANVRYVVEEPR
jgi:hypothetical protein